MKKILLAAAIAGALVAAPASAQWYAGAGIGAGHAKLGNTTFPIATGVNGTTQNGDDWNTSGKVFGGYQFTPNWGLEGQYVYLGKTNYSITTNVAGLNGGGSFKSESWGFAATGTLPLPNNFYVMGKLGVAYNHANGSNACVSNGVIGGCATVGSDHKTDLLAGVGAGYNFNQHWGIRLEYENFGKMTKNNNGNGGDIKGENWAVNVKYAF